MYEFTKFLVSILVYHLQLFKGYLFREFWKKNFLCTPNNKSILRNFIAPKSHSTKILPFENNYCFNIGFTFEIFPLLASYNETLTLQNHWLLHWKFYNETADYFLSVCTNYQANIARLTNKHISMGVLLLANIAHDTVNTNNIVPVWFCY